MWSELVWLRSRSSMGVLWTWSWIFGCHNYTGNFLIGRLLDSAVGLCWVKLAGIGLYFYLKLLSCAMSCNIIFRLIKCCLKNYYFLFNSNIVWSSCDLVECNGIVIWMNTQFYYTVYGTLLKYGFEHVLLIIRFVVKYCFDHSCL